MNSPKTNPYRDIFEEFVDNASFLWVLRQRQLTQPHVMPENIVELDTRINANLQGIMVSLDDAWEILKEASQFEQGGEAFTLAAVAFKSMDTAKIQYATEFGLRNEDTFQGLISALSWLPGNIIHPWIKQFFSSKDLDHKYIAIATCSSRREDPARYLNSILAREDCKAHPQLYAHCLKAIGEFKRKDLTHELVNAQTHELPSINFWALWSSAQIGVLENAHLFKPHIFNDSPLQEQALQIAFKTAPPELARKWITELANEAKTTRLAIKACALLGDSLALDWVITQSHNPVFARLAGETFYFITGIDLAKTNLVMEPPEDFLAAQQEEDNLSLHENYDENLPWPNPVKLENYWQAQRQYFPSGTPYFLGQPLENLKQVIKQQTLSTRTLGIAQFLVDLNQPMTPMPTGQEGA